MLRWLENIADYLKVRATQPIEQQAEIIAFLAINYSFAGHAFVTRNSNQTTREYAITTITLQT